MSINKYATRRNDAQFSKRRRKLSRDSGWTICCTQGRHWRQISSDHNCASGPFNTWWYVTSPRLSCRSEWRTALHVVWLLANDSEDNRWLLYLVTRWTCSSLSLSTSDPKTRWSRSRQKEKYLFRLKIHKCKVWVEHFTCAPSRTVHMETVGLNSFFCY